MPALFLGVAIVALAGFWFVPWVIRAAYDGRGPEILSGVITGQGVHPVSHYLGLWYRTFLLFVAVAGLVGLVWCFPGSRISSAVRGRLSGEPAWSAGHTLAAALWFGLLGGAAEAAYRVARYLIEHHVSRPFQWEAAWMGPISGALAFGSVGLLLLMLVAIVCGPRRLRVAPGATVFVLGTLATIGVLSRPTLRLAPYAVLLLGAGIGAALARHAASHPAGWGRAVRRGLPITAIVAALTALAGTFFLPGPLERRRIADLPPAEASLPDVVLIILDTVRAASTGLDPDGPPTTPMLLARAERGIVFESAWAPAPWTLPTHATLFTGRWPHELGVEIGEPLDGTFPTLAELLADRGYRTAGFSANFANASEATGLARGFARYEDFPVTWGRFFTSSWLSSQISLRVAGARPGWRLDRKNATSNTDDFLAWLGGVPDDRPFFAFLNYMDAHAPYPAPPRFRARFPSDVPPLTPAEASGRSPKDFEGNRALYHASIAYLDAEVDRLLTAVREARGDNVIVAVTSDHGEFFGEHGLVEHGGALYEPVLRVPLLLLYPGASSGPSRVSDPVSLRDLGATLLDLALPQNELGFGGTSWGGALVATRADAAIDQSGLQLPEAAFSETTNTDFNWGGHTNHAHSLATRTFHYIQGHDGEEALFDRASDPGERTNLAARPSQAARLDSLRRAVDAIVGGR